MSSQKEPNVLALEDLAESCIQDTLGCIDLTIQECESCSLDNEEDRKRVRQTFEKYIRQAFSLD